MKPQEIPHFPLSIFPKEINKIIDDTTADLNFPVDYIAASLLMGVATACGANWTLTVRNGWKERAVLFMALVGVPGAMKTHPINYALKPFSERDRESLTEYKHDLEEYHSSGSIGRKPQAYQYLVSDITMESLVKILSANPRGICVHVDELNGFFRSFNRYRNGGGDQEQWLSIFSGENMVVNRKTLDDVHFVESPFVCLIGSVQPGVLSRIFRGPLIESGFLFRILFVLNPDDGNMILWKDEELPWNGTHEWNSYISSILGNGESRNLYFSSESWQTIKSWQNKVEIIAQNDASDGEIGILRKIEEYALRFCIVIHAMREVSGEISHSEEVDVETVQRAIRVADYFKATALEIYDRINYGGQDHSKFALWYDALPTQFTSSQAVAIGENMQISRRTVFNYLDVKADDSFFTKICHGVYRKQS